mmetsp:Transcript_43686/g.127136  ORF Transcript_43686/g.127136 Transcript_43686/m.127136 type:complete len:287 (-) Transcript_43686:350-1210(-)
MLCEHAEGDRLCCRSSRRTFDQCVGEHQRRLPLSCARLFHGLGPSLLCGPGSDTGASTHRLRRRTAFAGPGRSCGRCHRPGGGRGRNAQGCRRRGGRFGYARARGGALLGWRTAAGVLAWHSAAFKCLWSVTPSMMRLGRLRRRRRGWLRARTRCLSFRFARAANVPRLRRIPWRAADGRPLRWRYRRRNRLCGIVRCPLRPRRRRQNGRLPRRRVIPCPRLACAGGLPGPGRVAWRSARRSSLLKRRRRIARPRQRRRGRRLRLLRRIAWSGLWRRRRCSCRPRR